MEINFSLLHLNQDSIAFISPKIDHTHIYTAVLFIYHFVTLLNTSH